VNGFSLDSADIDVALEFSVAELIYDYPHELNIHPDNEIKYAFSRLQSHLKENGYQKAEFIDAKFPVLKVCGKHKYIKTM
jgi:hypothetical protein